MDYKRLPTANPAFTIVELLIVIVVIGILATITIVSYAGIQSKAVVASLASDLNNASQQLKMFQIDNSSYPTTIDCGIPDSASNKCIKASSGAAYQYTASNNTNPKIFCLTATKGTQSYNTTQDSAPSLGTCPSLYLDAGNTSSYPGDGAIWTDLSGNGNNGTLYNGVSYSNIAGGVFNFDGVNDYIRTAIIPTSDSFAISIWFKTVSARDNDRLYWGNGTNRAILANYGTTGKLQWYIQTSTSVVGYITTNGTSNLGTWNNVVLQYTGNQVQCFINGTQDTATANITGTSNASAFNLGTNYNITGNWYNGTISEFRVYTRSLTIAEIQQNFNALRGRYGI